jgi:hypothetical protein
MELDIYNHETNLKTQCGYHCRYRTYALSSTPTRNNLPNYYNAMHRTDRFPVEQLNSNGVLKLREIAQMTISCRIEQVLRSSICEIIDTV